MHPQGHTSARAQKEDTGTEQDLLSHQGYQLPGSRAASQQAQVCACPAKVPYAILRLGHFAYERTSADEPQCFALLDMCQSCRDAHAFERKIKRARAKKNRDLAERLQAMRPSYRLDHLVKERCVLHPAVLHGDTYEVCLLPS